MRTARWPVETTEARAEVWCEDCITGLAARVPDDSVHLTVTSIPFEALFSYSGKLEDVGNNGSTIDVRAGRFALNMRFVCEQLLRVTAPGCNVCVHLQTLLAYKNQHGFIGRRDFRGAMVDVFCAAGFHWTGEFAIPKDPQSAANKLNLISLQFKTGHSRTSTALSPWINDYVMIFQKPGEVAHPVRPIRYEYVQDGESGVKNPDGWMTPDEWVRDASGVWSDILEIDVLDGARAKGHKEDKHEKHVCPLQLEVIRRLIRLYTNPLAVQPNVTVLDPFMGIGSTAWVALNAPSPCTKLRTGAPRNVIGFELKESYHRATLDNIDKARQAARETSLFAAEPPPRRKRKRETVAVAERGTANLFTYSDPSTRDE